MRSRLIVVSSLFIGAWIAACGSDGSAVDPIPSGDGGSETSTIDTDAARDASSSATDAPGLDGNVPLACDMASSAVCAPRKCDANLGCVACTGNVDCTGVNKFCVRGSCEACRTNTDCGVAAPVCSPVDNRCHLSCLSDAAVTCVGQTPTCDTTTGACVGCVTGATCPADAPLCEPTTKTCVQCTANSECPATKPHCFAGNFTCVECATTADCTGGKVCDPFDHRCTVICTGDAQCGGNTPKCDTATGACVQCLTKPDCAGTPATPLCDINRGDRCVHCIAAADCNADAGTPICDKDRCVQCKDNKDCPGPNPNCDNGTCR
jgi:hypothetical protein